jgi:phospholipid/cholesterol/gamma-HCH transport system ATP-binding protein
MTSLVECRGLAVGYDPAAPTLRDLDLRVGAGEIVALLGSSGCGKSTLLRTLVGLLPPLAGEVELFGEPLYDLARRDRLLRRTGTAFQQDALFGGMTVEDNVALPLRELTTLPGAIVREMVRMRLALVGLAGFERRAVTELSGGERKRAALARATILDPELVFCDEPSAGLDPVVAAGIDSMLITLRDTLGSAFVVVSHELASIQTIADRAVMLAHGTVHAQGTIAELTASHDAVVYNFFHRVPEQMAER